jgi:hypothetical protein
MTSNGFVLNSRHFLVFILGSYAVVVSLFLDAGLRNYQVLFAALVGGLLFFPLRLTLHRQAFSAFLVFSMMTMQSLFIGGAGQLGSVALTFVFALGYFAIAGLLGRVDDKRTFIMKVMRWIIYAFAMVSVIQLATSLTGLPVPNQLASKGIWSYNSLAYEPSHLGRIVGISMLCYLVLSRLPGEPERLKVRRKLAIAFFSTMILSGSSLAAIAILLVYGLSRSVFWLVLLATVSVLMWPMFLLIEFEPLQRSVLLASNLGSLDLDQVLAADHSGGLRVAPLLIYLTDFSVADAGFWFGYGAEGLKYFFQGRIPGIDEDAILAGFLPGFIIVYGAPLFALFIWVFVWRQANRTTLPLIVFWAIFMTNSAWNTQVFWYGLIVIYVAWATGRASTRSSSGIRQ